MKEFVAGGLRHVRALRRETAGLAATLTGVGFCFFVVDFVICGGTNAASAWARKSKSFSRGMSRKDETECKPGQFLIRQFGDGRR
jgi:hypothetical protein